MERFFDKRIDKDLVDVYTVFNCFSSDLIGTTVYASNSIKDFQDLDKCKKGIVDHINSPHGFAVTLENGDTLFFDFVIPGFSVKVEKTLKPYTLEEFIQNVGDVGSCVRHKRKDNPQVYRSIITEIREDSGMVVLGSLTASLDGLFLEFEYYKDGAWVPFGVEK
jgi:hypothetical protein